MSILSQLRWRSRVSFAQRASELRDILETPNEDAKIYTKRGFDRALGELVDEFDIDVSEISNEEAAFIMEQVSQDIFPTDQQDITTEELIALLRLSVDNPDATTEKQRNTLVRELNRQLFLGCMESNWANDWAEGIIDVTDQDQFPLEKISSMCKGCVGLVENNEPGRITFITRRAPTDEVNPNVLAFE